MSEEKIDNPVDDQQSELPVETNEASEPVSEDAPQEEVFQEDNYVEETSVNEDVPGDEQPMDLPQTELQESVSGDEDKLVVSPDQDDTVDEISGEPEQTIPDEIDAEDVENDLGDTSDEFIEEWVPGIDIEEGWPDPTMESVIEAILFASDEPISAARLVDIVGLSSVKQVRESIDTLNEKYIEVNAAFKIEQIAGGYQMMTHRVYNNWLLKMIRVRTESKLTQAALETLAIIAYKQPLIRADIEAIRGVASGEMVRSLMHKGLVKIAGRAEVLGRPMLYGTTKKFLEVFGLNSLRDLPKVEELKKPRQ